MACRLDGRDEHTGADGDDDHLFLIFNRGAEPQEFELPPNDSGQPWTLAFATAAEPPAARRGGRPVVTVAGESLAVYVAR